MMGDSKGQLTYPGLGRQLDLAREAGSALKWQRGSMAIGSVFCGNASKSVLWPCVEKRLNYLLISEKCDSELKKKFILEM